MCSSKRLLLVFTKQGQSYAASLGVACVDNSRNLSKADLDGLFFFTHSLGTNYEGYWSARDLLIITITNPAGANPPGVAVFSLRVLQHANLRGFPAAELPSAALSPILAGSFGPSSVKILKIQAKDPGLDDMIYNQGDTITITFNQPMNRAGQDPSHVSKSEIDAVLHFSHSLGADYSATWPSSDVLVIEILDATSSAVVLAAPYSSIDNSAYPLPHVDPNTFQVQWTETCSTSFCSPNGNLKSESFTALEDAMPLYNLLQRGQADPSIFNVVDLPCSFNRLPRGIIQNILLLYRGFDVTADFWLYIKVDGNLRDFQNTETFADYSSLSYHAMLEYESTHGVSLITHDNILVPLTGSFGPATISVTALTVSDPDNGDIRYGAQDQIEVKFSDFTNLAFMQAGQVVSKADVNALLTCEHANFEPGDAMWNECTRVVVSGAGAAISGIYEIQLQRSDGRPYYKQMVGGNYYIYSFCNKWQDVTGCPRWLVGSSVGSVSAAYFSESGLDPSLATAGSWQRWNGNTWEGSSMTVICDKTASANTAPDTTFDALIEQETLPNSCDVLLGREYTGMWRDRSTFQITIINASRLVGYYDSVLSQTCTPRPKCAITSVDAPAVGAFYIRIKPTAWLRNFPSTSGAVGHQNPLLGEVCIC